MSELDIACLFTSWRKPMLVLSRKPGEAIVIGNDIRVTVVEVKGGRIKIGIEAPDDVTIFRSELRDWIEPKVVRKPDDTPIPAKANQTVIAAK
jgi:carbon storage regulator